jgi:hypothetical protein
MVQWDPMVLGVLVVPRVLRVQMVPEGQLTQVDLEVPGSRAVPGGHLGLLVLDLRGPHFRLGDHHFLLVRLRLEVQEIQVFQQVPVHLEDLEVQPDLILVFPVDPMVQAVRPDPMDHCHLEAQRDQGFLSAQKNLPALVRLVVLLVPMVLEIRETLYHLEVLVSQLVLQALNSQQDPVAQAENREVRWVQMDQVDLRVQGNQVDPKVLDLLALLAVLMVLIDLVDQWILILLKFPALQCLLVGRLVLLVPEALLVPEDLALH